MDGWRGGENGCRRRGNSTWSYRSPGVPSRQCCRQVWSSRSGPPAEPAARSVAPMMIWSWGSPTPPGRCRSSCAGMHLADPAPDWMLRRSLGGGAAVWQTEGEGKVSLKYLRQIFPCFHLFHSSQHHTRPQFLEKASSCRRKCIFKQRTQLGFEPGTFMLWGKLANQHTTPNLDN